MKVAIYWHKSRTGRDSDHAIAMRDGLRRHGEFGGEFTLGVPAGTDVAVAWGWRRALRVKKAGFDGPVLVMERGYLGDRFHWTSIGWDGLNGHARFNGVHDPDRFNRHFAADLKPWRTDASGYALIMGQVASDAALFDVWISDWYRDTATALWKQGWDIMFRPHPVAEANGHRRPRVPFAKVITGPLDQALDGAGLVVAYNSNSLVDAVMAGVPIHAADKGSMVYDLASRDFNPIYPERETRLNEIANVQWELSEISSGKAWDIVKEAL